jgi:uncharacterized protein YecT (DUF1311 family)
MPNPLFPCRLLALAAVWQLPSIAALCLAGVAISALLFAGASLAAPGATSSAQRGLALPPDASQLRQDCNSGRPHVEIRACMLARSKASTQEVEKAEAELRDAINSRADSLPHLKHSAAQFEAAAKAHARYRLQQCEFTAGLAVGQGPQREQRLGCLHDFNLKRLQQLQQMRQALP